MRADPKRHIPLPAMRKVRDPERRNLRAQISQASNQTNRCDRLLRRFSWQTDEDK
jgi:hypothetical protein